MSTDRDDFLASEGSTTPVTVRWDVRGSRVAHYTNKRLLLPVSPATFAAITPAEQMDLARRTLATVVSGSPRDGSGFDIRGLHPHHRPVV